MGFRKADGLDLQIVHSDFPTPIPTTVDSPTVEAKSLPSDSPTQSRTEPSNATSSARSPRPLPPVPPFDSSTSTTSSRVLESATVSDNNDPDAGASSNTIPDQLISQLTSIQDTLRSAFAERPPHTIQRLAELVISPKRHYKTLPAWLRAVDRVVSVSSTADIFPLPHAQPLPNSVIDSGLINGFMNGDSNGVGSGGGILWTSSSRDGALGSDESLGGALLTPIPWMINRTGGEGEGGSPDLGLLGSDANSEMLVPEREDGAVTQGELIRMEQEAGIVPVSQTLRPARTENGDAMVDENEDGIGPHARGPDVLGVEDMGLQNGHGVEFQLGRAGVELADAEVTPANRGEQAPSIGDDDVVLADPDGLVEDDSRPQDEKENIGPDAVDATTL